MQTKSPILLATVVLGVLAIGGVGLLLLKKPAPAPPPAPGVAVAASVEPTPAPEMRYIAARDIPPRTLVTSDMLRRTTVAGPMPPGAITSLEELRGQITSKPIRSGDTLTGDSFVSRLERVIPARFEIPSGFRAVAIYVDPTQTAAGTVDVGDRVDVIATQKLAFDKAENQYIVGAKEFTSGRTIATNLLVLAVDQSLEAPVPTPTPTVPEKNAPAGAAPAGAPGSDAPPANAPPPPGGAVPAEVRPEGASPSTSAGGKVRVFLAAPLETASRLVAANDGGTLHVVIRNPQDGDAQGAPETREYPSHVITIAKPKENSGGGSSRSPMPLPLPLPLPLPDLPDVTVRNTTTNEPPMPIPVQASTGDMSAMSAPAAPAGPPTSDIMVVRGTEKVRVIVPKR